MGFPETLRDGIAAKGLSLHQLAASCTELGTPVTASALSYWLTDQSRPSRKASLAVARSLEHLLDAPPGTLTELVTPGSPPAAPAPVALASLVDHLDAAASLRARWDFPADDGLQRHLLMASGTITDDEVRVRTRIVMSANRNGADRFLFAKSHGEDDVTPVHGATYGRSAEAGDHTVYEVLLPRPLQRSEIAVVEFEHTGPLEEGVAQRRLSTARFAGVLAVNVDFRGSRCPLSVEAETDVVTAAGRRVTATEELPVREGTAQLSAWRVSMGSVTLRWRR